MPSSTPETMTLERAGVSMTINRKEIEIAKLARAGRMPDDMFRAVAMVKEHLGGEIVWLENLKKGRDQ